MVQQLDFSQGSLGENLLAKYVGNLFDGNAFTVLDIGRGAVTYRSMLVPNDSTWTEYLTRQYHKLPVQAP